MQNTQKGTRESGAQVGFFDEKKTRGQKSRDIVLLNITNCFSTVYLYICKVISACEA
jgi:hypothetical protein